LKIKTLSKNAFKKNKVKIKTLWIFRENKKSSGGEDQTILAFIVVSPTLHDNAGEQTLYVHGAYGCMHARVRACHLHSRDDRQSALLRPSFFLFIIRYFRSEVAFGEYH
jgi:hypothetical protein